MSLNLNPVYPQFTPLDWEHKPLFDMAFRDYPPEISEFTFTNLFSWRRAYGYKFSLLNGRIILRADAGKPACFLQPIGPGDLAGAIKKILHSVNGIFCRIPEDLAKLFEDDNYFEVREDRNNSDYLYLLADLVNLAGRSYDGKRNQIKKFKSEYEYDYLEIKSANAGRILEFEERWCSIKGCDMVEGLNNERQAIREIVEHFAEFKLNSGMIRLNPDFALGFEENGLNPCSDKACEQKNRRRIQCNTPRTLLRAERSQGKDLETFYQNPNANSGLKGRICALAIAEALNPETLVMHILKADPAISGAYQVMLNDFLRFNRGDFKYVNLEQDLGIPGLRVFKQSYQPLKLIKKYTISVRRQNAAL